MLSAQDRTCIDEDKVARVDAVGGGNVVDGVGVVAGPNDRRVGKEIGA